jgi:hypothetical protein
MRFVPHRILQEAGEVSPSPPPEPEDQSTRGQRTQSTELGNRGRSQHHPKTQAEVPIIGSRPEADRTARVVWKVVPGAAAHDQPVVFLRLGSLAAVVPLIGIGRVSAAGPFPDVADHVREAESVGRETAHRRGGADFGVPIIRAIRIGRIAPGEDGIGKPAPRRLLPLQLAGQATRQDSSRTSRAASVPSRTAAFAKVSFSQSQ